MFLSDFQSQKKLKIEKNFNNDKLLKIKIEIPAGAASITPPLGPLLGQYGINIIEFCKEFNEETLSIEKDTLINIIIFLAPNKSYYFYLKTPSVSYLIKKNLESLTLTKKQFLKIVYNIALLKLLTYESKDISISKNLLKNYINSIIGTFKSFNIIILK